VFRAGGGHMRVHGFAHRYPRFLASSRFDSVAFSPAKCHFVFLDCLMLVASHSIQAPGT
jgi:hypothetical protein